MITNIKTVASFIATAIWADNEYDEAEKVAVSEIADAFEFDEEEFASEVDDSVSELSKMDEYSANAYLQRAADAVDDEEIGELFEAALEIVLADGVLSEAEASELLVMAQALGISEENAMLMLADMVKEEPDLKVEL